MGSYILKVLLAMIVLFLHTEVSVVGFDRPTKNKSSYVKCHESEKISLLNFKHGLLDYFGMLPTWSDDEDNRDCCLWRGITCNNETGHVLKLDLHADWDSQYLSTSKINITSLIELRNLEYLDLSYNDFSGSPVPKNIGLFANLRGLNLSTCDFDGRIPSEMGNLSKLEYLDLSKNGDIDGEIPYQLGNLSQLKSLNLAATSLSRVIPFHIGNLPMLNTLKLEGSFDDESAEWLSSLFYLENLDLKSFSNLGSSSHMLQKMSKLIPNLRELRLVGFGLLDNGIPSLFHSNANFSTSLTILDLSQNMLTSSTLQFLSNYSLNLQELYVSHNNIVIASPLYSPHFPSLVKLDLSYNNLSSSIFEGIFNFSSKLQELDLGNCYLMDRSFHLSTASFVSSSSSLAILDLSSNLLKSSIFHWLFNFTTNVRSLNLDGNLIEGPIPDEFGKVLNSLEILVLSNNKVQGQIPISFGNICTLQELHLGHNNFSGEISNFIQNSTLCNRHKFHSFSSLRILDLSNNKFTGEIPESIGLLYELESLHLEQNHIKGNIMESHFNNLFKLVKLDLTDNPLSLKFDASWVPPFQLLKLGLASCKLGPNFPSWLQNQGHLWFLDISNAGINDSVPDWFWSKLQSINQMNMSHNGLKGTIPNLPFKLVNDDDVANYDDVFLVLNSNKFEGRIPAFLWQVFTLDLSNNKISDLNTFLCGKSANTNMRTLDLSNNQIAGQMPDCWEHLNSLEFLDLSDNQLSGKIPKSMGTLANLKALVLRNNSLSGELPSTLRNCTNLVMLDVGENLLSGPIPKWIGESLPQLKILSLRVNNFFGSFPSYLCYLRQIHLLDLSRNNLSKCIPSCLQNFTAMVEKSTISSEIARGRKMSSDLFYLDTYNSNVLLMWKRAELVFWDPDFLRSIDLSSNNFTGEIPKEVEYLVGLVSLNLSRNNLSGEILFEIGNLTSLDFLDLSRNRLHGKIPSSLSQIDRLAILDLSHNSLSGRIPSGRQLQTFDASAFEGNLDLCGEPLNKTCPSDETKVNPQGLADDDGDNSVFYEALYMSLGIGFFTGFWGLIGPILIWRPWRISYLRLLNRLIDYVYVMVAVKVAKWHRWLKG
ncbi:receptor-like protein EIX2 [Lotus japonicus]|uniref:receptor-like protein EIX2 n=1 Tax=Lotus japonicus TaxID=34305 RepID=UPI00258A8A3D|nr:receptor-like protein EIX2 [Lotus japonicus]